MANEIKSTRTKIVATVGPACRKPETLQKMIVAGVDIFRLNMAHGSQEEHEETVQFIRDASATCERQIAILVDLAGPKIRLGKLFQSPVECVAGATFRFSNATKASAADELISNYEELVNELNVGNRVMLADGVVSMEVIEKTEDAAICRVVGAGQLRSRQGINLPGVKLSTPSLTAVDLDNAKWAAKVGADWVSLSFVRSPEEIIQLKWLLAEEGSPAQVIAKIEKGEALDCLDDIVNATDGVMVARGDLGVEIDLAATPLAQKRIITACQKHAKPVIVATQMLDSMQGSIRPTRAEVSDVANAILDGADACMLSGETAIGKFPVQTIEMMSDVMRCTERSYPKYFQSTPISAELAGVHAITAATVAGANEIAVALDAKLIVIATHGGSTARVAAKMRGIIPIVGVSDSPEIMRQMALYWGVTSLSGAPVEKGPSLRAFVNDWGKQHGILKTGDRVVYIAVSDFVTNAHNGIIVQEVN